MRALFVVAVAMAMFVARPAHACGYWDMTDVPRGMKIGWLINSASIEKGERRLGAIYLDLEAKDGLRSAVGRKVQFDIKGNKLRKYGQPIATIDPSGALSFGKHVYTIELSDRHVVHDVMPAWKLVVKLGDDIVLESDEASALCAAIHREMTEAQLEDEVRRRVMFYLAWREAGG